jgi:hypothetical protein
MRWTEAPPFDRGNAYFQSNTFERSNAFGVIESFAACPEGEVRDPVPPSGPTDSGLPPCFVAPPGPFQNQSFPRLEKGKAPLVPPRRGVDTPPVR